VKFSSFVCCVVGVILTPTIYYNVMSTFFFPLIYSDGLQATGDQARACSNPLEVEAADKAG